MEPLIALVATGATLAIIGAAGVRSLRPLANPLRFGLAVMFAMTGTAHFVGRRDELIRMVPPALPNAALLVTLTGVAELVAVGGLLHRRTAATTAAGLCVLLVAMYPANVYAAHEHLSDALADRLVPRTAMELVFLAATTTVALQLRHEPAKTARKAEAFL